MDEKNICKCNTTQNAGEYVCCNCGTHLELDYNTKLPTCPTCGNDTFIVVNRH